MTRFLTLDDALDVVGWPGFHIRDAGLLASALARPATSFGGEGGGRVVATDIAAGTVAVEAV